MAGSVPTGFLISMSKVWTSFIVLPQKDWNKTEQFFQHHSIRSAVSARRLGLLHPRKRYSQHHSIYSAVSTWQLSPSWYRRVCFQHHFFNSTVSKFKEDDHLPTPSLSQRLTA